MAPFNHFAVLHLFCLAVSPPALDSSSVTTRCFFSLSLVSAVSGLVCWQQWLWHQPWPRRPGVGALLSAALAVEPSGERRPPLPLRLVCLPTGVLLLLQTLAPSKSSWRSSIFVCVCSKQRSSPGLLIINQRVCLWTWLRQDG